MEFVASKHPAVKVITCQNCGQSLSEKDQVIFEQAMSSIYNLPSETQTEPGVIEKDSGFKFAIEITPAYYNFDEPDVF